MNRQTDRDRWLRADTLESVVEVNEQALLLLRAQCLADAGQMPLMRDISGLLLNLDAASMRRAADSAVLLVDAGFAATLWSDAVIDAVRDGVARPPVPFFTVDGTVDVMRLVMTYAWHLARSEPAAARLLLGLSATNVSVIGGCTLRRLTRLAEDRTAWLRPRWVGRPAVWQGLLGTAARGESGAMQRMRTRGLQLLAAEARQA